VTTLYGQAASEKRAHENQICRQIVREINSVGISQRQALLIIHLLATELESMEHMRAITKLIRELGGEELFLIGAPTPDNAIEGGTDGTSDV
jgi:hypothetical protein